MKDPNIIIDSVSNQPALDKLSHTEKVDNLNLISTIFMGVLLAFLLYSVMFDASDGGTIAIFLIFIFLIFPIYFVLFPIIQIIKIVRKIPFSKFFPIYYYEIVAFALVLFLTFVIYGIQEITRRDYNSEGGGFPSYLLLFLIPIALFGLIGYFLPRVQKTGNSIGLLILNIITLVTGVIMVLILSGEFNFSL